MGKWARRIVAVVVVGGVGLAALYVVALMSWGHKHYEVDGVLHVEAPGPPNVGYPAIACMWANSYGMAAPAADLDDREGERTAFVICRMPREGLDIPFHVSHYSNTGRGLLIGGFLRRLPESVEACSNPDTATAVVLDSVDDIGRVCGEAELPPKGEVALMAPFDDDKGRPAKSMEIRILRAQ